MEGDVEPGLVEDMIRVAFLMAAALAGLAAVAFPLVVLVYWPVVQGIPPAVVVKMIVGAVKAVYYEWRLTPFMGMWLTWVAGGALLGALSGAVACYRMGK